MANITFTVLGARGSMPVSGDDYARYGGRTTAFTVAAGDTTLLVDCGTAVLAAADLAVADWPVFLTHYHSDHVQGLHFFGPVYEEDARFTFYGHPPKGMSLSDAIAGTFRPPFFPVAFEDTPSAKKFVKLTDAAVTVGDIEVAHARLSHPQGVTGYRFSFDGSSIVVATDHEAGDPDRDLALRNLAAGADVLVHDAQYTPQDYEAHRGWGHSTWEHAVAVAEEAGVGSLLLTSHDPWRTDGAIDVIVEQARARFPRTAAAREGMVLSTGGANR